MNTHPIDPTTPRGGFIVITYLSTKTTVTYAADQAGVEELVSRATLRPGFQDVKVKPVV